MATLVGSNFLSETFYNKDIADLFYPAGDSKINSITHDYIELNAGNGRDVVFDEALLYSLYNDSRTQFSQFAEDNYVVIRNFEPYIDRIFVSAIQTFSWGGNLIDVDGDGLADDFAVGKPDFKGDIYDYFWIFTDTNPLDLGFSSDF